MSSKPNPGIYINAARFAIKAIIAAMIALCYFSFSQIESLIRDSDELNHSNMVRLELQKTYTLLRTADSELNTFLVTQDSIYFGNLLTTESRIDSAVSNLHILFAGDTTVRNELMALKKLIDERSLLMDKNLHASNEDHDVYSAKISEGNLRIQAIMNKIINEENESATAQLATKKRNETFTPIVLLSFEMGIIIILFFGHRLIVIELQNKIKLENKLNKANAALTKNYEELKEQKDFIETILDTPVNLIAVYDKDGRFISFNKKCEEEFGFKADDVIGKTFLDIWPARKNSPAYQDLLRALKGEMVFNSNYQAITDGRYFQSHTIPIFNAKHEVYRVVAVANEITPIVLAAKELEKANLELKTQKEFVENLLNNSVDIICVFDTNLRFLTFNKKASEVFGMNEEMKGKSIIDLYPEVKGAKTHIALLEASRGLATHNLRHESVVVRKTFDSFFIPLKQGKDVYAIMMIHHDVTEATKTAAELVEKNRELQRSNDELEQFAYVASHDLQEPLRKIQTFANLTESTINDTERAKNYLQKIFSSAMRMSALISDVLNYSRVRATNEPYAPVDLNQVIENVKSDLELMIRAKKASIHHGNLPVVGGYQVQLTQLFSNLISNSLKFNIRQPEIRISCEIVLDQYSASLNREADFYKISVSDNGIGFEQKYGDIIFDVFKRLHNQHDYQGTGIGLAICKRIVSNHKGLISVTSELQKGSTFDIFLPVIPIEQQPKPSSSTPTSQRSER